MKILLAATCSGGNPDIGNRLAELLVPNMDEKIDPAMMAALMSACSLINAGAGTEEVLYLFHHTIFPCRMFNDRTQNENQNKVKFKIKEYSNEKQTNSLQLQSSTQLLCFCSHCICYVIFASTLNDPWK